MKQITEFDATPKCPKCDNDCTDKDYGVPIDVKYCATLGSVEACKGWRGKDKGDHLHIICGRCNYTWIMMTYQDHVVDSHEERKNPNKDFSDSCIMCDEKRLEMKYCSKSGNLPECIQTPLPKEHLHMNCKLCGAKFMTKTKEDSDVDLNEEFSEFEGELSEGGGTVGNERTVTVIGEDEEEPSRGTPR
jgi:hypothetical protein